MLGEHRGDAAVGGVIRASLCRTASPVARASNARGRALFISWTPSRSLEALSIVMNGTSLRDQRLRDRLAGDLAVPRPLEQDRANHLAAAEARRIDAPRAHLVDEVEHFLVARPGTVLNAIAAERLGGGAARLVERRDKAVAGAHLFNHLRGFIISSIILESGPTGSSRPSSIRECAPAAETKVNSGDPA